MKTSQDPRHKKRVQRVQSLFSYSYQTDHPSSNITDIIDKLEEIDQTISLAAPEWPLSKINRIDLAVLRVAAHELLYNKDVPAKVAIDEAVEIAKLYGTDSSPSFVNGVLGTIHKKREKDGK